MALRKDQRRNEYWLPVVGKYMTTGHSCAGIVIPALLILLRQARLTRSPDRELKVEIFLHWGLGDFFFDQSIEMLYVVKSWCLQWEAAYSEPCQCHGGVFGVNAFEIRVMKLLIYNPPQATSGSARLQIQSRLKNNNEIPLLVLHPIQEVRQWFSPKSLLGWLFSVWATPHGHFPRSGRLPTVLVECFFG